MRVWRLLVLAGCVACVAGCDLDKRQLSDSDAPCDGADCDDGAAPVGSSGAGGNGSPGAGGTSTSDPSGAPGGGSSDASGGAAAGSSAAGSSAAGSTSGTQAEPGDSVDTSELNPCATELLLNPGFEAGVAPWSEFYPAEDPIIYSETLSATQGTLAKNGEFLAWFGGVADETTRVSQRVTVPEGTLALVVSGYRRFKSRESQAADFADRMTLSFVQGLDVVKELFVWGNQDSSEDAEWELFSVRLDAAEYVGMDLTLQLECTTGPTPESNFYFDDLSLIAECTP